MKKLYTPVLCSLLSVCGFLLDVSYADDLGKGLEKDLSRSRTLVFQAASKARSGEAPKAETALLKAIAENFQASHLLMQERLRHAEERAAAIGPLAVERQLAVKLKYARAVDQYLALLDAVPPDGTVTAEALDAFASFFETALQNKNRPLLGSLPYQHLNYPARAPQTSSTIVPAYRGGSRAITPADTAASAEAPISKEITEHAQSLQWNPVLIYEWVKNNVETEWYQGIMKGAEETLRQKSGNDADQAALLVALLRASGFPARYVTGTIEFFPDLNKARNLTGIDDPMKIAGFFQKSGIPFKPVISGGEITNFQIEHVWVEAYIPYANYRGAVLDDQGKIWLGLDTSIKTRGYQWNTPLEVPSFDIDVVRDEYLRGVQTLTPLEFIKERAEQQLSASNPGKTYQDLLAKQTLLLDILNILPASLQFRQLAITGEYTELPAELRHKVRFTAAKEGSELFSITLDAMRLSNKQVILSYEPETVEDQQIIDGYGGLDSTPSYLVNLRPVLKVDGERQVVARNGLPMGGTYTLTIDTVSPNGTETISNIQIAGNLAAIGIVSQEALAILPVSAADDAETILFKEATSYIGRWNHGEKELAALLKMAIARPVPTVVVVGGLIDVTWLFDAPHSFDWKGIFIDAGLRRIETVSRSGNTGAAKTFMRLSSLQGSVLENRLFEDDLNVESVSTAKLLQLAASSNTPLVTVDKTNIDELLPALRFDDNVKSDIANAVNQHLTVTIPQTEQTYRNWSGIGYIKENPETGEAGWMLSGMVAGGMTASSTENWPGVYAGILQNTNSGPPNLDPASAHFIERLSSSDFQQGEVGKALPNDLRVRVTDIHRVPVKRAKVTFSVKAGGGVLAGGTTEPGAQAVTVTTDGKGIASVSLTLGTYTEDNPTFFWRPGDAQTQQVGENLVDASLPSGLSIAAPFTGYGFPGPLRSVRPTYGNELWGTVLVFASFVGLAAEDEYGNPLSNVPFEFSVADPTPAPGAPSCLTPQIPATQKTYLVETGTKCLANGPAWGECGNTGQQSLLVTTGSLGALAQVIMGGMQGALYQITATCKDPKTPSRCFDPATGKPFTVTFNRYTQPLGDCDANRDPVRNLILQYVETTDASGRSINAGKAGATIPIKAKLFFLREGETQGTAVQNCGGTTLSCAKALGTGQYAIDYMNAADNQANASSVSFDSQSGRRLTDSMDAKGVYGADYTLKPGINRVTITGTGTIGAQATTMTCPSTCSSSSTFTRQAETTVEFYGVGIAVEDIPSLRLSNQGTLLESLTIKYTIYPPEYQALTAYVIISRDGEPIAYMPAETKQNGTATLARGFWFDPGSSYTVQVVLNYGTGVEIRSELVPVNFIGRPFALERVHMLSQFDNVIPSTIGGSYIDSYRLFSLNLPVPTAVKVNLAPTDQSMPEYVAVPESTIQAGVHEFVVDYDLVRKAGFNPSVNPGFNVLVRCKPSDGSPEYQRVYPGKLVERNSGKMLGQVIVHDVLIQDGSLNLSRQDFAFTGRGPQLAFSRGYSNQDSPRGLKPLGEGWSHSLDMRLRPLSSQKTGTGPVPDWINTLKGKIFSPESVPKTPQVWTMVQLNGAVFKKYNDVWYAQRGRHGRLEEVDGAFVYAAKDGTRYRYDYPVMDETPVKTITDRNGNQQTFEYDVSGLLQKVTDAVGRSCIFGYTNMPDVFDDNNARLTKVACPDNVEIAFSYDTNGYLASVQRGTRIETYSYSREPGVTNGEYNLIRTTDSNNRSYGYEYHGAGEVQANQAVFLLKYFKSQDMVKKVVYPDTSYASFTYDMRSENARIVTDLRGNSTTYTLNYHGNPRKMAEPLGKTTLMTWSIDEGKNDNVMTSKTDPRSHTTFFEYDLQGNIRKETDPYGNSVTTVWNQNFNLPEERTDRNGVTGRWQYDSHGNLLFETDGDGKTTSHEYYPNGERKTTTDPRGNKTAFAYDQWGNPASVTGAEGSVTSYEYDIRGRRTASIDPNGRRTDYAYDALDNPTTTTLSQHSSYPLATGSSRVETKTYDPVGNLVSETDRLGLTLAYTYTPRNQVKTITRSTGGAKTFDYDPNGNLLSETDWKGIPTSHTYDELNRRVTTANRLNRGKSMKYDLNGNVTEETDFEGRVTNHEYDKLNRPTKTIQPALPGLTRGELVYAYYNEADPKTNLKTETDQEGYSTTYEYNGRYLRSKRTNSLLDTHLWEYDDAGNLIKETDEEGAAVRHEYDRQNRLDADIRSHDGSDVITLYGYDAAGNRTSVTDPLGRVTTTKYDEWNRPWQVIDAETNIFTTESDGEGNKVKTVDASGGIRTWTRDPRGLVTSAIDAESNGTSYTYDLNNNPETVTYANGSVTKITLDAEDRKLLTAEAFGQPEERVAGVVLYDKVGNPLQTRDGNGNITTIEYNALNLPAKVTDARGKFSTSDYYKTGKLKSTTDRRGYPTTTDYDKLWRVTKIIDPLLKTIETTYDKVGNVRTIKDKRGIIAETLYDDLYRPERKLKDGIRLATLEYDDANNLIAETDAESNRTEYGYTRRNQKEKTTYADGSFETYGYDGNGNLKTETDEEGIVTTHAYDKENRRTRSERAGEETQKVYDAMGNLVATIQPKGNSRGYGYDLLNRLIRVTDDEFGIGLVTRYEYDKSNNRIKTLDPRANVVENRYDELNRKTAHIQKKAGGDLITSFEYDEEGNQIKQTDAKGQISTHFYDELNRRTESHYAGLDISISYDENSNVTGSSVSGTGTSLAETSLSRYDNFDRLKTSTQRGTQISYSYDNNGNRLSVGTPTSTTSYTYDQRNRVETATAGSDVTTFDYYKDGKKKSVSYPNGASETYAYYPTNRIQTVTNSANGTTISRFDYTYDDNGNRLTQEETRGARSIGTTYNYDTLDRLQSYTVTESGASTKTAYTFDGYNRATERITTVNGTTTKTYSYDETDRLTQTTDGTRTITYAYDNNGNTLSKTDSTDPGNPVTYSYDSRDKLTSASKGGTTLGDYSYNANGYRIWNRNSDRGNVEYLYDGTAVIEERNGNGLLVHYHYANKLYGLTTPQGNQYYHLDALGSTTDLTDDSGATKASYFLNPWGMIVDSVGESVNRRIFTGKEEDRNTGLIYFGARYYDPDTALFTTQDTYLGEQNTPPSLHRYLYAYSNPTVFIDLEGYASYEWRAAPEKGFFDTWVFDREHAKDIYRGLVKGSPVGKYKPESARTDAMMDLISTGLEFKVGGEVVGSVAGKLKQPVKKLVEKAKDKLPGAVKAAFEATAKITTEIKNGTQELGQRIIDGTGGRLNPLNYTVDGFGSNLGNVKFRPKGKIIENIDMTVDGVTAFRKLVGKDDKVAVIGRNMEERVRKFAEGIGAETFEPSIKALELLKKGDPSVLMQENKKWVQHLKKEGYTVYDVGLDPKYTSMGLTDKGPFYKMETNKLFKDK